MGEIDWNQLQKDASDVVLPDGDYVTIVTKADAAESSNGKPMIKLQLTIVEGPKKDRKVFGQIVLSAENPFALQKWFANLASFGLDHAYFGRQPAMAQIAADLLNRGVVIQLDAREWQGSLRNNIVTFKPYVPNGPTPPGMVLGSQTGPSPAASTQTGPSPAGPPAPSGPPVPPSVPTTGMSPTKSAPPARPF